MSRTKSLSMSATRLWWCAVASSSGELLLALVLIGAGFTASGRAKGIPLGVCAVLTTGLALFRLRILKPQEDAAGRVIDHLNWRRAMTKPLEAAAGLPILVVLSVAVSLARALYPGSELPAGLNSFVIGIFAWSALLGLIGSAGADAAAYQPESAQPQGTKECATAAWSAILPGVFVAALAASPHLPGWWVFVPWTLCTAAWVLWFLPLTREQAASSRRACLERWFALGLLVALFGKLALEAHGMA